MSISLRSIQTAYKCPWVQNFSTSQVFLLQNQRKWLNDSEHRYMIHCFRANLQLLVKTVGIFNIAILISSGNIRSASPVVSPGTLLQIFILFFFLCKCPFHYCLFLKNEQPSKFLCTYLQRRVLKAWNFTVHCSKHIYLYLINLI